MQNRERPLRRLCRACLDLVAAWWRADWIRISPREGELLRLQPGCIVTVLGVPAQVQTRLLRPSADGDGVQYECRTESGPARLEVRFGDELNQTVVSWTVSGRSKALLAHQIEVFG